MYLDKSKQEGLARHSVRQASRWSSYLSSVSSLLASLASPSTQPLSKVRCVSNPYIVVHRAFRIYSRLTGCHLFVSSSVPPLVGAEVNGQTQTCSNLMKEVEFLGNGNTIGMYDDCKWVHGFILQDENDLFGKCQSFKRS